ncbi:MAG: response regulator transcription factor [Anaerolineales bacterium]|nr:response regulator transcription factor [Anaerolineales bacterium]
MPAKLLIIDDEILFTGMLQDKLPQDLFEVFVTHSGAAGIEAARELQPDVILLDLMMPGLSGWETCRAIRAFSQVPILVVSAVIDSNGVVQALEAGADEYLLKPVPMGVLVSQLKSLIQPTTPHTNEVT